MCYLYQDMGKGPIILLATCLSFSQSPHALENYNMEHFTQIVVVNSVATGVYYFTCEVW